MCSVDNRLLLQPSQCSSSSAIAADLLRAALSSWCMSFISEGGDSDLFADSSAVAERGVAAGEVVSAVSVSAANFSDEGLSATALSALIVAMSAVTCCMRERVDCNAVADLALKIYTKSMGIL